MKARKLITLLVSLGALACASELLDLPTAASASSPQVTVFPMPGSRVAPPRTQIAFRGVPAARLGAIVVSGSVTGVHTGSVLADSDGRGGSFIPAQPFVAGEAVTVSTSLNVVGASQGTFHFTVATPAGGFPVRHWPPSPRTRGDVWRFRSRPDLAPAAVTIGKRGRTAPGDIFLAPQFGPLQDGPMIVDPNGQLIWFKALSGNDSAADFRVQSYQGKPVLTWWQGFVTGGVGTGEGVINDASYRQIAVVRAANGLSADLHEFELTPQGTALITAYYPVYWNSSSVHASTRQLVLDSVVQEIDIPTGLVLFQWDSLDHVSLSDTYESVPRRAWAPFDYFHINSVDLDRDGDLMVSGRNTWAAYKLNHRSGAMIWRLGGKHSSFKLASGVYWAFQHDVRVRANNDLFVTIFDDSAGPPAIHGQSRGIKLVLDLKHMTARQVARHVHSPSLLANFEGNFQQLSNRDDFLGWGQQPYFTEYDPRGRVIFDGRFVDANANYRAYRFQWNGSPQTPPAVAASSRGHATVVYASWNGAGNVASWRVLGGSASTALQPIGTARKTAFETAITVSAHRYVAVQALAASGQVLGTSSTVPVG